MKNRKLILILSLVLALTMSLGGTLAYLTDTDADVNTMVLGNVKITQNEQQRVEIGNAAAGLESFEDGQMMLPGVYGVVDNDYSSKEDVVVGAYTVKIRDQLKNYIDKIVTVTNTGSTNAYVRTIIAIPAGINVDQGAEDVGDQWLHYNVISDGDSTPHNGWYWGKSTDESQEWPEQYLIEDVKLFENSERLYDITVATNINVLAPDMTTAPSLVGLFLDNDVDLKGDWYVAKDKRATSTEPTMQVWPVAEELKVYVLSQAVQADGFSDAFTAFTNSFGAVTAETAQEWFKAENLVVGTPGDKWPSNNPPVTVEVDGADKAAVLAAINAAKPGDVVKLTEDTTIAGYNATEKLVIEKAIILDLDGKTLTTECGWGGIDLKGGASIINGTINHTGNTAAIKAFQVEKIENVTINVTETAGKEKGGIVVQNGANDYVGTIKNVTINGATNGIECYRSTKNPAIGVMDNVTINAQKNGIYLNGAGIIGSISNSNIYGGSHGINAYLANLWHISLDIKNSKISGGNYGIDIWDEAATNTGSTVVFNYDDESTFTGATSDIKVTLQEEITCTINGEKVETPCDNRIAID